MGNSDKHEIASAMVALGASKAVVCSLLGIKRSELDHYLEAQKTTMGSALASDDIASEATKGIKATLAAVLSQSEDFLREAESGAVSTKELKQMVSALKRLHRLPNTIDYETKQRAARNIVAALRLISEEYSDKVPPDTLVTIAEALHKYSPTIVIDNTKPVSMVRIKFRRSFNKANPVLNERGKRLLAMWRAAMQGTDNVTQSQTEN